jgi:hypothetical protein
MQTDGLAQTAESLRTLAASFVLDGAAAGAV